jgi:hypothetical protein
LFFRPAHLGGAEKQKGGRSYAALAINRQPLTGFLKSKTPKGEPFSVESSKKARLVSRAYDFRLQTLDFRLAVYGTILPAASL